VLLPGRGFLEKGQSTLVSKSVIALAEVRDPQEAVPATTRDCALWRQQPWRGQCGHGGNRIWGVAATLFQAAF